MVGGSKKWFRSVYNDIDSLGTATDDKNFIKVCRGTRKEQWKKNEKTSKNRQFLPFLAQVA